jgi:sugar/nucleoside kinase (ribokinase family)
MVSQKEHEKATIYLMQKMGLLLKEVLPIPPTYQNPKVIHLITEYAHEPMANEALKMKANGSIYSLEPIIDWHHWTNKDEMLAYFPEVDIVTPDWPSASGIAGSDDPLEVLKFWTKLGSTVVAIRNGAKGSYVWDKHYDQMWHIPIRRVKAVDPTGCGNSYGGGLCVGWEKYRDAKVAGCCGTISASYLAKTAGIPSITSGIQKEAREALEVFLKHVKAM